MKTTAESETMHLAEKTLEVEKIYDGKILELTREKALLENGETAYREVVHHSGGVCVAALTDKNEVLMVRQFRYPFKEVLLEVPAGKREKDEEPIECGIRELKEECGAQAKEFIPLGRLYPTVAYDTEIIYMFLARGLSFGEQKLDEDEFLEVEKIPLDEACEMVMRDEIPDSKTQIALLKAKRFIDREKMT